MSPSQSFPYSVAAMRGADSVGTAPEHCGTFSALVRQRRQTSSLTPRTLAGPGGVILRLRAPALSLISPTAATAASSRRRLTSAWRDLSATSDPCGRGQIGDVASARGHTPRSTRTLRAGSRRQHSANSRKMGDIPSPTPGPSVAHPHCRGGPAVGGSCWQLCTVLSAPAP
eukprot:768177-Hanusia_phi.AAC.4